MDRDPLFDSIAREGFHEILLRRGRGNALRGGDLLRLAEEIERLEAFGAPPLVLASTGRSFCTGLDLRAAVQLDRAGMAGLMAAFHRALTAVFLYSGGVVAAVGGHALAGGAVLALACDRRLFASGGSRIGIHGVRMGVAYPDIAVEIVRTRFTRAAAEAVLYRGETHGCEEAVGLGWANGVVDSANLRGAAVMLGRELGMGGDSFASHKRSLLAAARERLDRASAQRDDPFLDVWFLDETQRALRAAVDHLNR